MCGVFNTTPKDSPWTELSFVDLSLTNAVQRCMSTITQYPGYI